MKRFAISVVKWVAACVGIAAAADATYAGVTWLRYGKPKTAHAADVDALLDMVMPKYEVTDRHKIRVAAPAEVTLSAAVDMDLESNPVVRAIFKGRQWILRSKPDTTIRPRGLLAQTKALGWGPLGELPGREIVMGAVTKPWEPNPEFRALPPEEFSAFREPGYVKIVWTLRADPIGSGKSVFRTETRAIATDEKARRKFRWYWSFLSPGISALRAATLPAVKTEAERRAGGRRPLRRETLLSNM
jgi:hypothetical protein